MTVFCPNCGKPNTDTAAQCVGCGTELQAKAPQQQKFKGTMMMSGLGAPPPPGGSPAAGGPPPGGPPPGGPPPGGPPGGAFGQPPAGGAPPGGAFGSPGGPPGGFGSPAPGGPPGGGFGGGPPPGGGGAFGAPPSGPPGGEKQGMAFQKTMAMSSAEAFGPGGPGAALGPPPGGPGGPPGGFGAPGGPPPGGGFGGGPGSSPGGGFAPGAPPGGGFGAPGGPPGGGFGAPPPSGPGGFGAPPAGGPPPAAAKKSSALKYVGIGCGALLLLSCCGFGGFYAWGRYAAQSVADDLNEAADEAVADATEASGGGAAGGSICDRAQRCCEAYVNEMNAMSPGMVNTATTCAGIAAARDTPFADTTCQSTIDGFRSGLTGAQRTVPADCAAQ